MVSNVLMSNYVVQVGKMLDIILVQNVPLLTCYSVLQRLILNLLADSYKARSTKLLSRILIMSLNTIQRPYLHFYHKPEVSLELSHWLFSDIVASNSISTKSVSVSVSDSCSRSVSASKSERDWTSDEPEDNSLFSRRLFSDVLAKSMNVISIECGHVHVFFFKAFRFG